MAVVMMVAPATLVHDVVDEAVLATLGAALRRRPRLGLGGTAVSSEVVAALPRRCGAIALASAKAGRLARSSKIESVSRSVAEPSLEAMMWPDLILWYILPREIWRTFKPSFSLSFGGSVSHKARRSGGKASGERGGVSDLAAGMGDVLHKTEDTHIHAYFPILSIRQALSAESGDKNARTR
jgi:hypothetical protein